MYELNCVHSSLAACDEYVKVEIQICTPRTLHPFENDNDEKVCAAARVRAMLQWSDKRLV